MIGIIGAMDIEIEKLKSDLKNKSVKKIAFLEFYTGILYSKEVVIVKSNEGKVNSAIATQLLISNYKLDYIINVGLAGSLDASLNIYDIAISKDTVEFDQDITVLGYEKAYTFGVDKVYVPSCYSIATKVYDVCKNLNMNAKVGTVISSDKFIVDENEKEELRNTYKAICTDMESASINHVACLNKIDFVALRVISDNGDDIEYTKFASEAAKNISKVLEEFFKEDVI